MKSFYNVNTVQGSLAHTQSYGIVDKKRSAKLKRKAPSCTFQDGI